MPITIIDRNSMCQNPLGSLNRNIPATTAPAAPIPVQIAYDKPNGSVRIAKFNKIKLDTIETTNIALGISLLKLSAYLRAITHTTSSIPAVKRNIQFIILNFVDFRWLNLCDTFHYSVDNNLSSVGTIFPRVDILWVDWLSCTHNNSSASAKFICAW